MGKQKIFDFPADFQSFHMNVTKEHLQGNNGKGRYIFLPGSDSRASEIAKAFKNSKKVSHGRAHHFYYGELQAGNKSLDVAVVSTGMGAGSIEIILNELFALGARRFLRLGTSGSLQPEIIRAGSIVAATSAVRDEGTTLHYLPIEVPAIASPEFIYVAEKHREKSHFYLGPVHSKGSLYAREFGYGPLGSEHHNYLKVLTKSGILASEMETSALYSLGQLFNHEVWKQEQSQRVIYGALLAVIGDDSPFASEDVKQNTVKKLIEIGFDFAWELFEQFDSN